MKIYKKKYLYSLTKYMSSNDYIIWEKEFDLEKVFNGVSTHHFWHCDNQLFDVEFYYKRDIIAMISYSKNVKVIGGNNKVISIRNGIHIII